MSTTIVQSAGERCGFTSACEHTDTIPWRARGGIQLAACPEHEAGMLGYFTKMHWVKVD